MGFSATPLKLPKVPKELGKLFYSEDVIDIIIGLHIVFDDYKKMHAWLLTKNPMFGGIAPYELITLGRAHKVRQFVNQAIEENNYGNITRRRTRNTQRTRK